MKNKELQNSSDADIRDLAKKIDDFMFDYDFYGYLDLVQERTSHIELLALAIKMGNVRKLIRCVKRIADKDKNSIPEAKIIINKLRIISK